MRTELQKGQLDTPYAGVMSSHATDCLVLSMDCRGIPVLSVDKVYLSLVCPGIEGGAAKHPLECISGHPWSVQGWKAQHQWKSYPRIHCISGHPWSLHRWKAQHQWKSNPRIHCIPDHPWSVHGWKLWTRYIHQERAYLQDFRQQAPRPVQSHGEPSQDLSHTGRFFLECGLELYFCFRTLLP